MTAARGIRDEPSHRSMGVDALLDFSRRHGVIESFRIDGDVISISNLGANYRVNAESAIVILLRMLDERPPLGRRARCDCRI